MLTQKMIAENNDKKYSAMPRTKIMAFAKEFTCFNKCKQVNDVEQIFVTRLESLFLDYLPYEHDDDYGTYVEEIFFFDRAGNKVLEARNFLFYVLAFCKRLNPFYMPLDRLTIKQQLERLGKNLSQVHFIMSYYPGCKSVIIYKLPVRISISKLLADYEEREQAEIALERELIKKDLNA